MVDNGTTNLRQGRVRIRYKYTPVPPLEDMELYQTFTDESLVPHLRCWEVPDGCTKHLRFLRCLWMVKTKWVK
ncbi:Major tail sheath protein FI [Escherichia coli]|uniref:Major tail sheath protein FI n=1 Tax=Escherichia coli TaxID=562 RepID=A0A376KK17_ECOLX|nr:Major tail sheath protein FI [Escherichia coli]